MATVLLLDDERTSSARLLAALQDDGEHQTWTAETLNDGVKLVEDLGSDLDLLILDVSMFNLAALSFLDFFAGASPLASVLLLSPSQEHRRDGDYRVLRKPFSDREFLDSVAEALTITPMQCVEANRQPCQFCSERIGAQARWMPGHSHHNRRPTYLAGKRRARARRQHGAFPRTDLG